MNKTFAQFFPLVIEHDERQGTIQNGTEGILTFIGQVMRPFHHFFRNKEVDRKNFPKKWLSSL